MLKLTKHVALFSKRDVAEYIAASMALAVRDQLNVMQEEFHQGEYDNGWLETLKQARVTAETERDACQGLLNRLPYLSRKELADRLTFFVDVQRVRAKCAFRKDQSGEREGALDAWNTWAILDDALYATA